MLKFTEEEIKRKSELRALIAADPKLMPAPSNAPGRNEPRPRKRKRNPE